MDPQAFKLITDKFDEIRADLHEINTNLKSHVEKDEFYWKKLDTQETQITMLKKLIVGASMIVGGIWTMIWSWLSK